MTVIRLDQRTSKPPDFATMASNKKSHLEAMKELLAHPEINVNQADSDGWTSIIMAFFYGHAKVVTVLLAHPQICINQADTDGWTPLLRASQKGHVKVVEGLLADPNINVNKAHNDSFRCNPSLYCISKWSSGRGKEAPCKSTEKYL